MTLPNPDNDNLLVVGAVHIDELASAQALLVMKASNAISWSRAAGGVAGNAARAAHDCNAGTAAIQLIGAVGEDLGGQQLEKVFATIGIDARLHVMPGRKTGRYTAVIDADGELALGLSDVSVAECWNTQQILQAIDWSGLNAMMFDANLTGQCIEALTQQACTQRIPTAAMAVSPSKALRLISVAPSLQLLFLNRREALALCHANVSNTQTIVDKTSIEQLADGLQALGFSQFILTDGDQPVVLQTRDKRVFIDVPVLSEAPSNVNGAGDAMAGATFAAWAQGFALHSAIIEFGLPMAAEVVMGKRSAPAL